MPSQKRRSKRQYLSLMCHRAVGEEFGEYCREHGLVMTSIITRLMREWLEAQKSQNRRASDRSSDSNRLIDPPIAIEPEEERPKALAS